MTGRRRGTFSSCVDNKIVLARTDRRKFLYDAKGIHYSRCSSTVNYEVPVC